MSKLLKPESGVVYECCKGFFDINENRVRVGQRFLVEELVEFKSFTGICTLVYQMNKASGRGFDIYVPADIFPTYFSPVSKQTVITNSKFKVGDIVRIAKNSEYYNSEYNTANPPDMDGIISEIKDSGDLNISVDWENGEDNNYNECDLILSEQESYLHTIEVTMEQLKELMTIPFMEDQIKSQFPELFTIHRIGNRYEDRFGSRYILVGEYNHVALTNLETGLVESDTIEVNDMNKLTSSESNKLNLNNFRLIKERQ